MEPRDAGRGGFLRKASGWGMLTLGIAGCVLPVLPGIPLVLAGLIVLAHDYRWARSLLGKAKRRLVALRRRTRSRAPNRITVLANARSRGPVPASEPGPSPDPLP